MVVYSEPSGNRSDDIRNIPNFQSSSTTRAKKKFRSVLHGGAIDLSMCSLVNHSPNGATTSSDTDQMNAVSRWLKFWFVCKLSFYKFSQILPCPGFYFSQLNQLQRFPSF